MGQGQKVGILVLLWGFLMSFQPPAKFHPEAVAEAPTSASML